MKNSHNSSFENLKRLQQNELSRLYSADNQDMLKKCFQILNENKMVGFNEVIDFLDLYCEFLRLRESNLNKNHLENAFGNIDKSEFLKALMLAESRVKMKQIESPLGGRISRISKIEEKLNYALSSFPFSKRFYEICDDLETQYSKSTIYKALKRITC